MSVTQDTAKGKAKGSGAAELAANPTMAIWRAYCVTPPGITKRVKMGRREFTAVCAYHQIEQATRLWGPVGKGWGWDVTYEIVGAEPQALIVAHVEIWHSGDRAIRYPVTSAAKLYQTFGKRDGAGAGDAAIDSDAHKKALTDAITKGLSYLGFAADVFQGKFDDNKYVADRLREEREAEATGAGDAELSIQAAKQRIAILMRRMGLDLSLVKDALQKEHGVDALDNLDPDAIGEVVRRVEALGERLAEIQSVCDALAEQGAPQWKAVDALRDWAQRRGGEDNPLVLTDDEIRECREALQESVGDGVEVAE